jgi:hypothetical protein
MGVLKRLMLEQDEMKSVAADVAQAAGLLGNCEHHPDIVLDLTVESLISFENAYKIANARISKGEIELPLSMSRRDFTDLIHEVVKESPWECPSCDNKHA